jgi:hypothetical protein
MENTTYQVAIMDADGCMAMDEVIVDVIDVHCGNKLKKVQVCHIPPGQVITPGVVPDKAKTICIAAPAVPDHLAHGDHLGPCGIVPCDGYYTAIPDLKSAITDNNSKIDGWKIYPNPAHNKASIELSEWNEQEIQLTMYDITAKVVWRFTSQSLGSPVLEVDLENIPSGIYQVVLQTKDKTMVKKLMISK